MLRDYYYLTKPGIIRGNMIVATAGFLLAAQGRIDWQLLTTMIVGLSLVIASACVTNNIIDRHIDRRMKRTKDRAVAAGRISTRSAALFAAILGVAGLGTLLALTNLLTAGLAVFGWVAYVWWYGAGKRASVHGTAIGSISGAVPPAVGYAAVTNNLDTAALLLFAILVCWQMPHFYAIAMYRAKDYAAASIPVLPLKRGMEQTKLQIVAYIVGFTLAASLLTAFGYTGYSYLAVMLAVGAAWLWLAVKGFRARDDAAWAKSIFGYSLLSLLIFSLMISVEAYLP